VFLDFAPHAVAILAANMGDVTSSRRWAEASKRHRANNPLCVFCQRAGRVTAAEVVDHIVPRTVAPQLTWVESNWQSLCKHCHNVIKQRQELYGFHDEIDRSGWPIDPLHPANSGRHKPAPSLKQFKRKGTTLQ